MPARYVTPQGHQPTVARTHGGFAPSGNRMYSTVLRCECGWETTDERSPALGGRAAVAALHRVHAPSPTVEPARSEFHEWMAKGIERGWLAPHVDRTAEELSMLIIVRVPG